MNKNSPQTLWRWICQRILTLAVITVVAVAGCMFLRFALQNLWVIHHMPPAMRQEFLTLRDNPDLNRPRFHEIVDERWGVRYSDPSVGAADWAMVVLLLFIMTPFVAFAVLRYARPLALQFSHLKKTADRISAGQFGKVAPLISHAPAELLQFTSDFNRMSQQLALYDRELRASHVALAHELRSPLTAAIGRLQGIRDGVFEPEPQQLDMVMKQLRHMSQLIDELHLLSLADVGQLQLNIQVISPGELARDRVAWVKPQAEQSGMKMTVVAESTLTCTADPFRLGQVFSVLIDNALRYGKKDGELSICARSVPGGCSIEFRDDGPGVDPSFLTSMFERFTRADASRARNSGGSGLGLSIARAICEAHGGRISAKLPADGGLSICIFLPNRTI
jgi:two-component system sensor histidine kinase AdeS